MTDSFLSIGGFTTFTASIPESFLTLSSVGFLGGGGVSGA